MHLLTGKQIAEEILNRTGQKVKELAQKSIVPGLAVVWVGESEESRIFIKNKKEAAQKMGIKFELHHLNEAEVSEEELINLVENLNSDSNIHGIVVQLPLPKLMDTEKVLARINPEKDVDGFAPENLDSLLAGRKPKFVPAVAQAVLEVLNTYNIDISGKKIAVLGRGRWVGWPTGALLSASGGRVKLFDSNRKPSNEELAEIDILVAATGQPQMFGAELANSNLTIIDVGTTLFGGKLRGDVRLDDVRDKVSAITPVPGGVGPVTVAVLLENVVLAAKKLLTHST